MVLRWRAARSWTIYLLQPLITLDLYGTAKPLFVRLFIEILRNFFREIGPPGFSVALPSKQRTLLV